MTYGFAVTTVRVDVAVDVGTIGVEAGTTAEPTGGSNVINGIGAVDGIDVGAAVANDMKLDVTTGLNDDSGVGVVGTGTGLGT